MKQAWKKDRKKTTKIKVKSKNKIKYIVEHIFLFQDFHGNKSGTARDYDLGPSLTTEDVDIQESNAKFVLNIWKN